jgi:lipid II:glycine glycyltransferase (peptidoglycan interpeptide bridge formation enzyme)
MGVAYLRWGPLFHRRGRELDAEVVGGMADALLDEYVRRRGLHLEVLPNAFRGSRRAEVLDAQFQGFDHKPILSQERYRTFLLDISLTTDELRKNLDRKWRNQLNAGTRNNLEVLEGQDAAAYEEFRSLYEQMWQRKKFESAVRIEEFQKIQQRLPEQQKMKIFLCRVRGKSVAALVCSALGDTAIYLLGATNEDGLKVKASYVLQWAAIRSAKECGTRFYDLGGIDPVANPGVYNFKSGLSGRDISHIGALTRCENPISAGFARASQVVRGKLRAFQHATRPKRVGEQSR